MINAEKLRAYDPGTLVARYGPDDAVLYALSIGIGMRPTDPVDLRYVYEASLQAFPTYATVLGWPGRLSDPEYGIDHRMVVAADLEVELHRPLAISGTLSCRPRISHVFDKGAGSVAIVCTERTLVDEAGQQVATVRNSILARNHGGFGGSPDTRAAPPPIPGRAPDLTCDLPTAPNQALLFRLHGDSNPIHANPALAEKAGFRAPLLHGACSFGIAGYALVRSVLGGDPARFGRMRARFVKPFFPGEVLRTEMWVEGDQVLFRSASAERGEVALDQGVLQLKPA